jgi:hypothetical protein
VFFANASFGALAMRSGSLLWRSAAMWKNVALAPFIMMVCALAGNFAVGGGAAYEATEHYALPAFVDDASETPLSTKKIMGKAHKGEDCLISLVHFDLHQQGAGVDWRTDEKNVAEMVRLVGMLSKNDPPKGDKEAWDKRVKDYVDKGKALQEKLKEKKLAESRAALDKLETTCKGCHQTHNPH